MPHFGIICPPVPGHLNPILALGRELQARGHSITLINFLDAEIAAQKAEVKFQAIAATEYPLGKVRELQEIDGKLSGLDALKFTIQAFREAGELRLRYIPAIAKEIELDALLVDQVCFEGGTIAEHLGIPFITICNALIAHIEPDIPPFATTWSYQPIWWARWRNQIGYTLFKLLISAAMKPITSYRQQWSLQPYSNLQDAWSTVAQISQQPVEFDFPRKKLPAQFHYTSPFINSQSRKLVDFPWNELNEQCPLIYASMGTLKNRKKEVFEAIAMACTDIDAQLVISLGGASEPKYFGELPGFPVVVSYAPQLELLQRASLCITHAGINTVLESLRAGVPMVAIPVGDDQPGIAARLAWVGAGEFIELEKLNSEQLRMLVQKVLTETSYQENARRLQTAIGKIDGVKKAADIVEQAIAA
jgi:zeaxanthin glucosyltransferase